MGKSKGKYQPPKNGHANKGSPKIEAVEEKQLEQKELEPIFDLQWHSYIALGLFVSVYLKCTSASIPSGDAGDFIMAAQHFGVAHPPGYPLYVTAGYVWMKLMPFGNPAFKLNVLTSFIGGLAAFVVYLTTYKITKFIPSAVFASTVFGFSHLIWFHSVGAEIFSLNNLFCSLLLYWVVRFQQADVSNRARVAMEASFLSGLSMCNQHTSALFIVVIGGWMFLSLLKDKAITMQQFLHTGVAFGAALTPYIQLPVSAYFAKAPSTWGDQRTVAGIWKHVAREEYGTFRLTADDNTSGDLFANMATYTSDLVHELTNITLVLCLLCVATAWFFPRIRTVVYVYVANIFVYMMFFCNQANIDHSRELMKGVLERFWMQSNIPVSILAGCGIWCLYSPIKGKCSSLGTVLYYGLGVGALIMGAYQIRENYTICDMSSNLIMRDYGRKLLDALPANGVLLVEGDMPSLTSRYLRYCENYRPDVDVVDQELIGFNWYKPMHKHNFRHYTFPYDREVYFKNVLARKGDNIPFSYNFQTVFDVHTQAGVPLYIYPFMKQGDEGYKQFYDLLPTNMLYEVRHKQNSYTVEEFLDIAYEQDYNFNDNMAYCDGSLYPVRSWEYVIAESCGHTAFFPAEHAHRMITIESNAYLQPKNLPILVRIFKLYKRAYDTLITKSEDGVIKNLFAADHNKNYGVICYLIYNNLAGSADRVEAGKYAKIMVEQWETYFVRIPKEDTDGLTRVIDDVYQKYPDIKTNQKYEM
ncbi:protein O-mannosyl-transferase TMEM260-like isoform X1 [Bolinopsis microptera]|uniref:protein O-mannosyl-transferase TMEM260-like isoform X1 n=1 Tax=Bolinopsis microptera TaxID=2820187 RepID=UPI003078EDA1